MSEFITDLATGASFVFVMLAFPLGGAIIAIDGIRDGARGGWTHAFLGVALVVLALWFVGGLAATGWYVTAYRAVHP